MRTFRDLAIVTAATLAASCNPIPSVVTQGSGFGGRLDVVYIARGQDVLPVGTEQGENSSGAIFGETLLNANGQPIGGMSVPVVYGELQPPRLPDGGGQGTDGGITDDGGIIPDGGIPDDGGTADLAQPDLKPADAAVDLATPDLAAPDGSANGGGPRPQEPGPFFTTSTKPVTLIDWMLATVEVRVTPVEEEFYDVRITADNLVPRGLYSAWLNYVATVPNPKLYAVAPLGGLPSSFIPDEDGHIEYTRRVSRRYFEQFNVIPLGIQVGASGVQATVTPLTAIIVTLHYHSNGQTNANATFAAMESAASEIPEGQLGVIGHVGVDVHPHVSTIPMQSIPRRNP